jgi:hypothetical protein
MVRGREEERRIGRKGREEKEVGGKEDWWEGV